MLQSYMLAWFVACILVYRCHGLVSVARALKIASRPITHTFHVAAPLQQYSTAVEKLSLTLSDGGLDADTLSALGDVQELNDALDGAVDGVGPAVGDILQTVVASPFIIAVPIAAGLLVAFGLGFFIFSWGSPKE